MNVNPLLMKAVLNGVLAHTAARGVKRGSTWLGHAALAGGIALIALIYFSIAGYSLLLESFEAPAAAAMVGGALLSIAGIIALTGYMSYKRVFDKPAAKNDGLLGSLESGLQSVMGGLQEPIKDNPALAMIVAALAGYAAGDRLGGDNEEDRYH